MRSSDRNLHNSSRLTSLGGHGLWLVAAMVAISACGDNWAPELPDAGRTGPFVWDMLPEGLPAPYVPEDNPMTYEQVELGRHLFYDERLSGNGTQSCASCHHQDKAFSDGLDLPIGSTGEVVPRNSPALMNVAYHTTFTWMNPNFYKLHEQIAVPLFGEFPVELGVSGSDEEVLSRLLGDPRYQDLFASAYPEQADPFDFGNVAKALASFVRSMVSFQSAYDRYTFFGEEDAMTPGAIRGSQLILEERLDCFHCHGNFHFSLNLRHEKTAFPETGFANNGLYNIGGDGSYPAPNEGLVGFTGNIRDRGKFRSASLRNVAITEPYMHDGSLKTLEEVLDMYARGGRNVLQGPNTGDGRDNPFKSEFVHGFELTNQERQDVLEFLDSLTDDDFRVDPRFENPFEE